MTSDPLTSLAISHLRGSTTNFLLPFDTHKKLTIVYGENATGKSTVCDGFEVLGTGRVGSLENRGLGSTSRYWPSMGKNPSDIQIVLKTQQAEYRATVNSKGDVAVQPQFGKPSVDVLRRSQIVSLILATEGDRYKEIAHFIDVSAIQSAEATLVAALKMAQADQKTAITRITENNDAVEAFWVQVGSPGADALVWARSQAPNNISHSSEIASLTRLCSSFDRFSGYPERLRDAGVAIGLAETENTAATAARIEEAQRFTQGPADKLELLEVANHFFRDHPDPSSCPLCESGERAAGLPEAVSQKLTAYASLQSVLTRERSSDATLQGARQRLLAIEESLQQEAEAFATASTGLPDGTAIPLNTAPTDADGLTEWFQHCAEMRTDWDKARRAFEEDERFYGTLRTALATYDSNVLEEAELSLLIPGLEATLEIVSEERHSYVDDKLALIANDVGRLYERVHPGEGLDKISLALNPKQRASLVMGASFEGQDVPPQAYFSDSHLDTLGLCIFVAMAKLEEPLGKILVLDDVLGSVDEPHVERLIEMICEEAENFRHCVVTTHYRPWKEKLRWGWLKTGQCHFVELAKWSVGTGLTLTRTLPEVERLKGLLADPAPDLQGISSKAGVILEAALDFLTLLYQCSIPRKPDGEYTLHDLLFNISSKLRGALRVEVLQPSTTGAGLQYQTVQLGPILDELERIAQARNVFGAHFKDISFQLLDADALGFGTHVLALMDALTDQEAGWPKSDKSGSYWATSGETRRLHPLKRPS